MARPLEQGDRIGVRLKPEARRMLAAASLGVSKSQLVRAIVVQALRHESIARAALEDLDRPDYPQFVSAPRPPSRVVNRGRAPSEAGGVAFGCAGVKARTEAAT